MTPYMQEKLNDISSLASGFDSRSSFKENYPAEYKWLAKYGLIKKAMPHTSRDGVWNYESALDAAKSCKTRNEFFDKYSGARHWAKCNGCLDDIISVIPTTRKPVCPDQVRKAALQCKTRCEFYGKFTRYYSWCVRNNVLDEYCAHMTSKLTSWTVEQVADLAKDFKYRKDFEMAYPNAYRWAHNSGNADFIFANMDRRSSTSDYDIVYMWEPCGFPDVFKVGVTSKRLGDRRMKEVASRAGLEISSVITAKISGARAIEAKLLALGKPFDFGREFTGSTEFRFYLPEQFDKCMEILQRDTLVRAA